MSNIHQRLKVRIPRLGFRTGIRCSSSWIGIELG